MLSYSKEDLYYNHTEIIKWLLSNTDSNVFLILLFHSNLWYILLKVVQLKGLRVSQVKPVHVIFPSFYLGMLFIFLFIYQMSVVKGKSDCLVSRRQTGRDCMCTVPYLLALIRFCPLQRPCLHKQISITNVLYSECLCKRVCHCIFPLRSFALTVSLFPSATSTRRLSSRIQCRKPRRNSARTRLQPVSQ